MVRTWVVGSNAATIFSPRILGVDDGKGDEVADGAAVSVGAVAVAANETDALVAVAEG